MFDPESIPYCGVAPSPSGLWSAWNFDPLLLTALGLSALGLLFWEPRRVILWGALACAAVLFVSPLCALGSALFSARIVHHAIIVAVIAPLVAWGLPLLKRPLPLAALTGVHALIFWLWHAPGLYGWALSNNAAFWLMQVTLFGSAGLFWAAVRQVPGPSAVAALLATMIQMGLLGALIAFANMPLYAPHLTTTLSWGLTPLEDQQVAGMIMWAPMAGIYLLAAMAVMMRWLGPDPAPRRAPQ